MLAKTESYTSIEIKELGQVQLRKTTTITDSGSVISTSHHREVRNPGSDVSDLPSNISASIAGYWTTEVLNNWDTFISSSLSDVSAS